jgi:hypothetical protein
LGVMAFRRTKRVEDINVRLRSNEHRRPIFIMVSRKCPLAPDCRTVLGQRQRHSLYL